MKCCALVFLTLHPHLSTMSLDNLTGDVEANAQPRIGFFFGISDLADPVKNLLLMLFVNSNPTILDTYQNLVLVFCDTFQQSFGFSSVLDCIVQTVIQHFPHTVPIAKHFSLR